LTLVTMPFLAEQLTLVSRDKPGRIVFDLAGTGVMDCSSARGIVFVTARIFLVVAAAEAKPQQAKGIDSALRALAGTPLGPWLLVLVAIGLIMFGVFSCCEAKWMRL
jgi:uncharacterized membrane protein (DUF2068 family)